MKDIWRDFKSCWKQTIVEAWLLIVVMVICWTALCALYIFYYDAIAGITYQ